MTLIRIVDAKKALRAKATKLDGTAAEDAQFWESLLSNYAKNNGNNQKRVLMSMDPPTLEPTQSPTPTGISTPTPGTASPTPSPSLEPTPSPTPTPGTASPT